MLRIVVVVVDGDVQRRQLVRQQAAADGVCSVGAAHDAAAGLAASSARVVPGHQDQIFFTFYDLNLKINIRNVSFSVEYLLSCLGVRHMVQVTALG